MELKEALKLKPAIVRTWGAIGYDVMSCAEECGARVTNVEAIESCLDADRLVLIARDEAADDLYRALLEMHGYSKVLKYLTKNLCLSG